MLLIPRARCSLARLGNGTRVHRAARSRQGLVEPHAMSGAAVFAGPGRPLVNPSPRQPRVLRSRSFSVGGLLRFFPHYQATRGNGCAVILGFPQSRRFPMRIHATEPCSPGRRSKTAPPWPPSATSSTPFPIRPSWTACAPPAAAAVVEVFRLVTAALEEGRLPADAGVDSGNARKSPAS